MLKIRFQRVGRKNRPHFRLVLADSKTAAGKNAKEILGWKDPIKHTEQVEAERVKYWLSFGAQVSDTAHNFLVRHGVVPGPKIAVHKKPRKDAMADAKVENAMTDAKPENVMAGAKVEGVMIDAKASKAAADADTASAVPEVTTPQTEQTQPEPESTQPKPEKAKEAAEQAVA